MESWAAGGRAPSAEVEAGLGPQRSSEGVPALRTTLDLEPPYSFKTFFGANPLQSFHEAQVLAFLS